MSILKFFVALLLSLVLIMPTNVIAATENNQIKNKQRSTWLWNTEQIVQNSDKVINFLLANNVKDLYLQIDYTLNLNSYRNFIKKASTKNISVHALDGSPDWVDGNGTDKQQLFFDWLTRYQKISQTNEKFRGVHLDVEPYLNKQYSVNKSRILENYQSFLLNALSKSKSLELSLSVDIPFWFDEVTYNTKYGTGGLAEWVIKSIKNVVVMAYRDNAAGDNGIINLVLKELKLGKQYGAVVTIAVETQKSSEGNNISFYEEGQNYMNKELDKVYANYKGNSSFGGFAIHHVMSWMNLEK